MNDLFHQSAVAENRALGRFLVLAGRIWLYLGTFGVLYLALESWPASGNLLVAIPVKLAAFVVGGVLCAVVGSLMVSYGRRLQVPPGEPLLMDPTAPLVLYLRSFSADSNLAPGTEAETALLPTAEEALARHLERVGTVVAIGRPGEALPPIGVPRVYRSDAEWQAAVLGLMQRARLTVLAYGSSPGLVWEISAALAHVAPGRFLLWFPTRELWHAFRDFAHADCRWTRGLPSTAADVLFLGFHDDGTPRVLEVHAKTITHDFSTETIPDPTLPGEISPGGLEAYLADLAAELGKPMK